MFDFLDFVNRQNNFEEEIDPLDCLRKKLAGKSSISVDQWIDIFLLAIAGARQSGATDSEIAMMLAGLYSAAPVAAQTHTLAEFIDSEALEGVAAWLEEQELTVNVGNTGDHGLDGDTLIESSAGWLLRLVRALQDSGSVQAQPAPVEAIGKLLTVAMEIAVANGANSVSMPDEYVEVAAWLFGIPAQHPDDAAVDREDALMSGQPAASAEPSWQHRIRAMPDGKWGDWMDGRAPHLLGDTYRVQERPVFAAPIAAQAQAVVNKQLTTETSDQDREDDEALADTQRAIRQRPT